jgi:ATP-dependent DNA helicase RecG
LPEDWTVKYLYDEHPSRPYNPDIANAFFCSGYVEAWGRGIDKMSEKCVAAGLPVPQITNDGSDFWITFRKDIYNREELSNRGLNERQIDALLFFKAKGVITTSEYMKKYDMAERTAREDLSEIVAKGLLLKKGETKSVKYVYAE